MSETTTTTPVVAVAASDPSGSPATQGTANASSACAAAIVVIAIWLMGTLHIAVPPDVSTAFTVLIGAVVHWLTIRFAMTPMPVLPPLTAISTTSTTP